MTRGAVGFLGLGAMGGPMVLTLLRQGWSVTIAPRDRVRAQVLADAGASVVADPAEMAARVDLVIACLPDTESVRDVLFGSRGLLTPGRWHGTFVDCSTLPPAASRLLAEELAARGTASLDAPVSGGPRGAEQGTLSIMVGGPADVLEHVRPALEAMGSRVIHCGPSGSGQVTKACNQLIVMSTVTAVAEALRLAEHAGVDPWIVREVLLGGYAASPILELHGPRIINDDYAPGGRAVFHAKDIATIEELCARADLELPLFRAVRDQFQRLFAVPGGPDLDHSAVATLYPRAATGPAAD